MSITSSITRALTQPLTRPLTAPGIGGGGSPFTALTATGGTITDTTIDELRAFAQGIVGYLEATNPPTEN